MLSQQIPPSPCWGLLPAHQHLLGPVEGALSLSQLFWQKIFALMLFKEKRIALLVAWLLLQGVVFLQQCSSSKSAVFTAENYWYSCRLEHHTDSPWAAPILSQNTVFVISLIFTISEWHKPPKQNSVELSLCWGHLPADLSQSWLMPHRTSLQQCGWAGLLCRFLAYCCVTSKCLDNF